MKRKIIWLVASCLAALSLALAACAPAAPPEEKVTPKEEVAPKETATPKEEVTPKEVAAAKEERPRYGGTLNLVLSSFDGLFDNASPSRVWNIAMALVYDELIIGDWARGPAGTNEVPHQTGDWGVEGVMAITGALAESWEMPDDQTIIFKIRKGVHFQNKPPANGRELTVDDVVYNIERNYFNPKAYNARNAPEGLEVQSITALDKQTVEVKVPRLAALFIEDIADKLYFFPPESVKIKGNMDDWSLSLGTGPFILTNYVSASSLTFVRNPDYWMTNPAGAGKGDRLPYLDGIRALIIADESTQMSALRTGKVDLLTAMGGEDFDSLMKTNPQLKYKETVRTGKALLIRAGPPAEQPALHDQRVRQALSMAIDREAIIRDFYGGRAVDHHWKGRPGYIFSWDEMPETTRKLYQYRPDEAKKLLAEAGYPNGFQTSIVAVAAEVDELSLVKGYWADIGVELKIDVKEPAVRTSMQNNQTYPDMTYRSMSDIIYMYRWTAFEPRAVSNTAGIDDSVINAAIKEYNKVWTDIPARIKIRMELEPYIIELGYWNLFPPPFEYRLWQPWLKNYHGENELGMRNTYNWLRFPWIDQELKQSMTGKR